MKKIIDMKMEVKNLACNEKLSKRCNHPLLPQGIGGLIIGKSGCGKTRLLINLLLAGLTIITDTFLIKVFFNQSSISSRKLLKESYPKR